MTERRPSVFVGSSGEGLDIAKAIQVNLDRVCEVVPWTQGVFGLGKGNLENLVDALDDFDFAILVLTPDDMVESHDNVQQSPRDNVLLELGLFIGHLGRERTFAVYDRTANMKMPSDLAGVTNADYELHSSGNLQSSMGAACTLIENRVREKGIRKPHAIDTNIDQTSQFQVIYDLLDVPAHSLFILMHETGISLQRATGFGGGIRYVYASEYSCGNGTFSVDKLCSSLPEAGLLTPNLRNEISLTDRGHEFAEWLISRGFKCEYFASDVGTWGEHPEGVTPIFDGADTIFNPSA